MSAGADPAARRRSRAALLELAGLLVGPLPSLPAPRILEDTSPDPGLFGPDSVTWRIAREPLLLAGGGRALLMQVAHPLVAQGVVDHSSYATDPYGRLLGTVRWLVQAIFGTTAEAEAACARVGRIHAPVRGVLAPANATGRVAAGASYSAGDPALALWVHATIVESMLVSARALLRPLPAGAGDRFVREWEAVGVLMGVEPPSPWRTAAELHAYVAQQIERGIVAPVPASRCVARTVLRPPAPWPAVRPLSALLAFLTAGLLPDPLRRGYRLHWTARRRRLFLATCALLRAAHPLLPRRLRVSPLYDIALARTTGPGTDSSRSPMPSHVRAGLRLTAANNKGRLPAIHRPRRR